MTPRPRRPTRTTPKPRAIVILAEDPYDAQALEELVRALCPAITAGFRRLRSPLLLRRDGWPPRADAEDVAALVEAERRRYDVACVFVHRDCDDYEDAAEAIAGAIETALRAARCPGHAVVPAWEMEAWWFLWPDAAQAVVASWRAPEGYLGREVGMIRNAKEEYRRAVRPAGRGTDYTESMAPKIAAAVRRMGIAAAPRARSQSYDRFRSHVAACCAAL